MSTFCKARRSASRSRHGSGPLCHDVHLGLAIISLAGGCVHNSALRAAAASAGAGKGEASTIGCLLQTKALIMIIFINILPDKHVVTSETFTATLLMAIGSTMLTVPVVAPKLSRLASLIRKPAEASGPCSHPCRMAGAPLRRDWRRLPKPYSNNHLTITSRLKGRSAAEVCLRTRLSGHTMEPLLNAPRYYRRAVTASFARHLLHPDHHFAVGVTLLEILERLRGVAE